MKPARVKVLIKLNSKCKTVYFSIFVISHSCCVSVELTSPWRTVSYIPQNSSVNIHCTFNSSVVALWSLLLPGRQSVTRFSFGSNLLNRRGFYIGSNETIDGNTTIHLTVNSTLENNGTVVRCTDARSANIISATTIMVYGNNMFTFPRILFVTSSCFILEPAAIKNFTEAMDVGVQAINISWNPVIQDPNLLYTLSVKSVNTNPQLLHVQESYLVFAALESSPPCEVYNFSVAATYVGATYTGDGCSVPSPVISRMLPSQPDISNLESSLNHSLEKTSNRITFQAIFEVSQITRIELILICFPF